MVRGAEDRQVTRTYLDAARRAARWIASAKQEGRAGTRWQVDPSDPDQSSDDLYAGGAGIVAFLLELHRAAGAREYLSDACSGAERLLQAVATTSEDLGVGLYSGLSGIAFALLETYRATGDRRFREGVERCLALLQARAVTTGQGVSWNECADIISGSAGTGLLLLTIDRQLGLPGARELAIAAGRHLIDEAIATTTGLKWAGSRSEATLMPNFSHGTAGVAYFLAALGHHCGERGFVDAAVAGADYLRAVAETDDNGFRVFHHEPGGEQLFYLGWCNGPVGTVRLFYALAETTGDAQWMGWVQRSAHTVLSAGVPGPGTSGYWDNVGQCCGSAGVAQFSLDLYQVTGERCYLEFAGRIADDLLQRATVDGKGLKWVQAEHRLHPDLLVAQTGFMQGAAGIGMLFLRLDALQQGRPPAIVLPDDPWRPRPPVPDPPPHGQWPAAGG